MANTFTPNRNLEKADGGSVIHEPQNDNQEKLEVGLTQYCAAFGEIIAKYDPICQLEADDEFYICKAGTKTKIIFHGLAVAIYAENDDGFIYGPGCLVPVTGADWTRNAIIYVNDAGSLSETPGTYIVIAGWALTNTIIVVGPVPLWLQLAKIADTAAVAGVTATTPGTGADGTTWTGAQCTLAYNDLVAHKAQLDLIQVTQDAILDRLEKLGISADV